MITDKKYNWLQVGQLPELSGLPDPFYMQDGRRAKSIEDWMEQRCYLQDMLAHYLYGCMPPKPTNLSGRLINNRKLYCGKASEETYVISCGDKLPLNFKMRFVYPDKEGKFPIVIKNSDNEKECCPIEEELVVENGYALAVFNRTDLAPDSDEYDRYISIAYPDYNWRAIAVWAWGYMRALDFLMMLDINADFRKVCITGHSRGGKAALCAGIYDERFAIVVPNGSGCGGAGCLRILGGRKSLKPDPDVCETVGRITTVFPHWWVPEFGTFGSNQRPYGLLYENRLPFDSNFIRALIAPRVCLSTDSIDDEWANPYGTQLAWQAVQPVFDFLNSGENNLFYMREGKHEHNEEDWRVLLSCCNMRFYGKESSIKFNKLKI